MSFRRHGRDDGSDGYFQPRRRQRSPERRRRHYHYDDARDYDGYHRRHTRSPPRRVARDLRPLPNIDETVNIKKVVEEYKARQDLMGYTTLETKSLFINHLQGKVREFYLQIGNRAEFNFEELVEKLSNRFDKQPLTPAVALSKLKFCRMSKDEDLDTFADRVMQLCEIIAPGESAETLAISHFMTNLSQQYNLESVKRIFADTNQGRYQTLTAVVREVKNISAAEQSWRNRKLVEFPEGDENNSDWRQPTAQVQRLSGRQMSRQVPTMYFDTDSRNLPGARCREYAMPEAAATRTSRHGTYGRPAPRYLPSESETCGDEYSAYEDDYSAYDTEGELADSEQYYSDNVFREEKINRAVYNAQGPAQKTPTRVFDTRPKDEVDQLRNNLKQMTIAVEEQKKDTKSMMADMMKMMKDSMDKMTQAMSGGPTWMPPNTPYPPCPQFMYLPVPQMPFQYPGYPHGTLHQGNYPSGNVLTGTPTSGRQSDRERNRSPSRSPLRDRPMECYNCGGNHLMKDCQLRDGRPSGKIQCYQCQGNHLVRDCPQVKGSLNAKGTEKGGDN